MNVIPNPAPTHLSGMAVRNLLYTLVPMDRTYCVYILASRSRTLYAGVTNNLERRMEEHQKGIVPGFTSRYRIFRLVHYEVFGDVRLAIAREKEIKGRRREKKVWLIERDNPTWDDLAQRIAEKRKAEEERIKKAAGARKKTEADPPPPFAKITRPGSG